MSAGSNQRSEDQFLCPICLDVFTDPVSTPCGHNYCKTCITLQWDINRLLRCPLCNETFHTRPQLKVNTFIREMVAQFRREAQQEAAGSSSRSEQHVAKPGEVSCDICTGTKLKALKSCLVCLASFCQTHLEPHLTLSGLKRHQLMEPVENLEDRMCKDHDKPLELFCKTDQTCICWLCSTSDHKTHEFVPLREEYERKKMKLRRLGGDVQLMIQKRRLKIQKLRDSVIFSKDAADRETAEGVQVLTALMEAAQRGLEELREKIQDNQRTAEEQAEDHIKDLDQEISELRKRGSEVEQLLHSEDHLHLLQSFSSLKAAPSTKNWTQVQICPYLHEGAAVTAVAKLKKKLKRKKWLLAEAEMKTFRKKKKLNPEAELQTVQQYAVDVTLDPDTAHPILILSGDGKQVHVGTEPKTLPNNPERFSKALVVLGNQSFSSGRFYFEVQVRGKTKWGLGVVQESISRKEKPTACPQNGYFVLAMFNGQLEALASARVPLLHQSVLEKVGVFVDFRGGLVSFYDVDAAVPIFSFTGCCFTGGLLPFFCPSRNYDGKNSAPLVVSRLSQACDLTGEGGGAPVVMDGEVPSVDGSPRHQ